MDGVALHKAPRRKPVFHLNGRFSALRLAMRRSAEGRVFQFAAIECSRLGTGGGRPAAVVSSRIGERQVSRWSSPSLQEALTDRSREPPSFARQSQPAATSLDLPVERQNVGTLEKRSAFQYRLDRVLLKLPTRPLHDDRSQIESRLLGGPADGQVAAEPRVESVVSAALQGDVNAGHALGHKLRRQPAQSAAGRRDHPDNFPVFLQVDHHPPTRHVARC